VAALDGPVADRWWAARIPAWVFPALICFWFVTVLAIQTGAGPGCVITGPGSCGPELTAALLGVSVVGVPVLLWWSPAAGCAAGIVCCAAHVLVTPAASARIAGAGYGLACGAVAIWVIRARMTQRAILASSAGMPVQLTPVHPGGFRRSRILAGAALLVVSAGLYAWYDHVGAVEDRHRAVAATQVVQIVAIGDKKITVVLASGARHTVAVSDVARYPTGSSVPVLTDPGDPAWVRLVTEADDPTGWAAGAFGGAAAALAVMAREAVGRRARRRLVTSRQPGIQVRIMTDERAAVLVYAADDARGERPLAVVPVRWASGPAEPGPPGSDQPGVSDGIGGSADERAFGRAWRGEVSEDVTAPVATLVGRMHDDAWPAFVIGASAGGTSAGGDTVLLPTAPLRTFRSPPSSWWRLLRGGRTASGDTGSGYRLPGRPIPVRGDVRVPGLPAAVRGPGRYRVAGAVTLAGGLLGAPIAVLLGLDVLPAVWLGGILLANGLFAMGRRVILDTDRLTVRGPMVIHRVPWEHLHGARLVGDRLVLAWTPAAVVAVGPFAPAGDRPGQREQAEWTGAAMMLLRERAGAAGPAADPGVDAPPPEGAAVSRAPGPGVVLVGLYILLVAAAWWHAQAG
jgi:hypothetical protein